MEKLGDHAPDTINFDIGYFEGKQSKKRWLCCQEDLEAMYKSHRNGDEIMFWCEARTSKRKKMMMMFHKHKVKKLKWIPFIWN